jgi:hypothetical protein
VARLVSQTTGRTHSDTRCHPFTNMHSACHGQAQFARSFVYVECNYAEPSTNRPFLYRLQTCRWRAIQRGVRLVHAGTCAHASADYKPFAGRILQPLGHWPGATSFTSGGQLILKVQMTKGVRMCAADVVSTPRCCWQHCRWRSACHSTEPCFVSVTRDKWQLGDSSEMQQSSSEHSSHRLRVPRAHQ